MCVLYTHITVCILHTYIYIIINFIIHKLNPVLLIIIYIIFILFYFLYFSPLWGIISKDIILLRGMPTKSWHTTTWYVT
jgi:hypothetical protein